jgi:hypothetical protein
MQKNRIIWIRAVTVIVAAKSILVSALAMSSEIDHKVLNNHSFGALAGDVSVIEAAVVQSAKSQNATLDLTAPSRSFTTSNLLWGIAKARQISPV